MNGEHFLGVFIPKEAPAEQTSGGFTKKIKKLGSKLLSGGAKVEYKALPEKRDTGIGHVLIYSTYKPGQPFVYYTGSAWSLYDVPTRAIWQETLRHEALILQQGLIVESKK